MSDITGADFHH